MPKKKSDTPEKEEVVLTEWQKRNLEFLKKRKEDEEEQKRINEKLRLDKRSKLNISSPEEPQNTTKIKKLHFPKISRPKIEKKQKKEKIVNSLAKTNRIRTAPIFVVAFLVILVSVFLLTPFSKQKTITVSGNQHTPDDILIEKTNIQKNDYFFSLIFKHKAIEQRLAAEDVWVKTAQMTYQFPNKFHIQVQENKIIAYAHIKQGYQPVLETGKKADPVNSSELPKHFLTINLDKEDSIKLLIKDLKALDPDLISEIQVISLADSKTTPDLLLLDMHDGNSIRIPLSKFKERLPFYKQIKKNLKEPSIVDMEVGVYTTTNTIESTPVKAEDTKNKSTDKTQTQNGQVAENSQGQTNNSNTNQQGQQIATEQAPNPQNVN